jgi:hypothetical protein
MFGCLYRLPWDVSKMKYYAKILFLVVPSSTLVMCASVPKKTAKGIDVERRYGNQSRFDD